MAGSLQQIRLGPPEGSAEGSTKVPARVHQGSTRVRKSCDLCSLLGQICFGVPKVSVEGSPITSLNWSSRFLSSILDFCPTHGKGLGAKWPVCLLGLFAASGFRLPKGSF